MTKIISLIFLLFTSVNLWAQETLSLNGKWLMGSNHIYTHTISVPGIHTNPTKMNDGPLWYKRKVILPQGNWNTATLILRGARFAPMVYINGRRIAQQEGGMAPIFFTINGKDIQPGKTITLEIKLTSLRDLSEEDASYIATSDHWRSNISSSLWDDVLLHVQGKQRIGNIITDTDPYNKTLKLKFYVENLIPNVKKGAYHLAIKDQHGNILCTQEGIYNNGYNTVHFSYDGILDEWSPEHPQLYMLVLILKHGYKIVDKVERRLGLKKMEIKDRQIYLNGKPCKIRGGSVTWHRWMRTLEGDTLGYDSKWFKEYIIDQMKNRGANEINFHLGLAPSRLLDLCDEAGILVRYEWPFFHAVPATIESAYKQYSNWMTSSMEHPCVAIYYPYNETSGSVIRKVWTALDSVLIDYPPLVFSHRDITHLHKYWWSIFENLGLYYDNYKQFEKAVIADEFGGNYLDSLGNYGGYPQVREAFPRMIGRDNTREQRLRQLSLSTGKIGEYWRRMGIAGWTPYTILSGYEDGNNWFLGNLAHGKPMPVWDAMTAVWSPQSVSLEIWNTNFQPLQRISIPLYCFNDLEDSKDFNIRVQIIDSQKNAVWSKSFIQKVNGFAHTIDTLTVTMPDTIGSYTLQAELLNGPSNVKYPILSAWDVRTFRPVVDQQVAKARIYIPSEEKELRQFATEQHLNMVRKIDQADVILTDDSTWQRLAGGDNNINTKIERAIRQGQSLVMLSAGNRSLGKAYPTDKLHVGTLLAPSSIVNPKLQDVQLFGSIHLKFKEAVEPETHIFPDLSDSSLFEHLPRDYRGMWNGFRGDLVVPAWEMDLEGVNADIFIDQWVARGADCSAITSGKPYYAYEHHGYYMFSTLLDDDSTRLALESYVKRLIDDAPSLAVFINSKEELHITDIAAGYRNANTGMAKSLRCLVNAGKNLTRVPVMKIEFGNGMGNIVVSQMLSAGRLSREDKADHLYDICYDGTTVQMVLNMIKQAINNK